MKQGRYGLGVRSGLLAPGSVSGMGRLLEVFALLVVGLLVGTGCTKSTQVKEIETKLSVAEAESNAQLDAAVKAHEANPDDQETARALARAYLDADHYFEAYDLIQKLREGDPNNSENLHILGQACVGLGMFEQAMSCFLNVVKNDPSNEASRNQLALVLATRSDSRNILSMLAERGDVDINLLAQLESTLDRFDAWRKRVPPVVDPEQVIRTKISDSGRIELEIDGRKVRVLFDSGAFGLAISDDFATRAGLDVGEEVVLRGFADTGVGSARAASAKEVKIGDGVLKDVRLYVIPDLGWAASSEGFDGVVGPDLLNGYSFRLDRKGETLEFFPPGHALPAASERAVSQPFSRLGSRLLTDVVVKNRTSGKAFKVKMLIATGTQKTLYNLGFTERLGFGQLDTTDTLTMGGAVNYAKAVAVNFSEVQLGGANFAFPTFYAVPMEEKSWFEPYGYLGLDVLREFRVSVDMGKQVVTFDPYL